METKICSKCKIEKKVTNFTKSNKTKDTFYSHCKDCQNYYERFRKNNDPIFKLRKNITRTIRHALLYNKSSSFREKSKIKEILGCSLQDFKAYLESQFEPWMNWDNRGLYNGQPNYGWDIDHIIPKATAKTIEEVIKLNHHTNLRPRCSYLNRVVDVRKKKTNT